MQAWLGPYIVHSYTSLSHGGIGQSLLRSDNSYYGYREAEYTACLQMSATNRAPGYKNMTSDAKQQQSVIFLTGPFPTKRRVGVRHCHRAMG